VRSKLVAKNAMVSLVGNDSLIDGSDPIESMLNLAKRYPPLYHYTRRESLQDLLTSKGLLASPTWDFSDTEEYVFGLKVIQDELKKVCGSAAPRSQFEFGFRSAYGDAAPLLRPVLERCIDLLGAEIANYGDPAVKVYVACVTTVPDSQRMVEMYGDCVLAFNFELPWIAYHAPNPFTSTMLSRVTYDEQDLRRRAIPLGLLPAPDGENNVRRQANWLLGQTQDARIAGVAGWITEKLCLLAPNLIRPEFAYEHEWRLKSAISSYSSSPHFPRRTEQSQASHLPTDAEFRGLPQGRRYLQQLLSIDPGKMIVRAIGWHNPPQDPAFWQWYSAWSSSNASPVHLPLPEFAQLHAKHSARDGT
jgi:hypothetical protein